MMATPMVKIHLRATGEEGVVIEYKTPLLRELKKWWTKKMMSAHLPQTNQTPPFSTTTNCLLPTLSRSYNNHTMSTTQRTVSSQPRLSTLSANATKARQLSHLHAQLAQMTAKVSDMENLLRMTSVQAESMRGLGGYAGGM